MAAPPPPAAVAADVPSAYVEIAGAWTGRIETTHVTCMTHPPKTSTFTGWQYMAQHPDNPDGRTLIDLKLDRAYEDATDSRRPLYSPSAAVEFLDENGVTWVAHSSWSVSLDWDGPAIELAPDRRTISFSAATAVRPDNPTGVDLDRISWVTISGVITCPAPLPDLP